MRVANSAILLTGVWRQPYLAIGVQASACEAPRYGSLKAALRGFARLQLLILIALAACAPQGGEPQPPDIAYGQDVCDECGMLIDEPRFAAASLTTDGVMSKFDDIGDMLAFHAGHPDVQVHAWFVHDYPTEEWIRGETAYYVQSSQIVSPMGHGIAAFRDRSAAETFAGGIGASVLRFDALRAAH